MTDNKILFCKIFLSQKCLFIRKYCVFLQKIRQMLMRNKQWKIPHTFTIVLVMVLLSAALTWALPGGAYERETIVFSDGGIREAVIPGSYHKVGRDPQTWQFFSSFYDGFVKTAHIIVFIFMVGGAFWIVNATGAVKKGVERFLCKVSLLKEKQLFRHVNVNFIVISLIMVMFSLFGAVFGMSEETLAFMVVFVPLSISMGYDSLVGMGMCYLAAHAGFAGGMLNPFTIGIAQGLAGLPAFSGLGYRFICWIVFTLAAIVFVLWYARRVARNPQSSPMYEADAYWRGNMTENETDKEDRSAGVTAYAVFVLLLALGVFLSIREPLSVISLSHTSFRIPWIPFCTLLFLMLGFPALQKDVRYFVLDMLLVTLLALVIGVLSYAWYIREIAALFFALGLLSGLVCSYKPDKVVRLFLEGCGDMLNAALVVGLAGGILVMLEEGHIVDTMLYGMSQLMDGAGRAGSAAGMYLFQNALNLVIPSGSAKAALTVPIMAPFADLLGISRQTMVLAFQFGDGITNMITPASGVLIGCLGVARIPYSLWMKWIYKWILFLLLLGFLLLLPTLYFTIAGF